MSLPKKCVVRRDWGSTLFRSSIHRFRYVDFASKIRVVWKQFPELDIPISEPIFEIQRQVVKFILFVHILSEIEFTKIKLGWFE